MIFIQVFLLLYSGKCLRFVQGLSKDFLAQPNCILVNLGGNVLLSSGSPKLAFTTRYSVHDTSSNSKLLFIFSPVSENEG